jgi:ABC-type nickel/cobalt efflux system permease component RcnA
LEIVVLLGTALLLGVLHSLEPDHLAAVSAFVVRRPARREALGYGLRWAAGHGGVILLAGSALVLLRIDVDASVGHWLERVVGGSLVLLGGWVLLTARTLHAHFHRHEDGTAHVHLHAHPEEVLAPGEAAATHRHAPHHHRHAATAIGALHGLAGTAPAVALIPLVGLDSLAVSAAYLLVFGVGTAVAMGLYAMFAGVVAGQAAVRSERLGRGLARLAGLGTVVVGLVWLVG